MPAVVKTSAKSRSRRPSSNPYRKEGEPKLKESHWVVSIANWGILYATGPADLVEAWRKAKCNWERSIGTRRKATKEEIAQHYFTPIKNLIQP